MTNPAGTPIWYELMTPDPDGAKRFYDDVVGWTIGAQSDAPMDYRMITAPGGMTGGVMRLSPEMQAAGARPLWTVYFGVDDTDAATARAKELGAHVFVPPTDIPDVGRFALLGDPQHAPFYIMKGSSDQTSGVFAPGERGRCSWNELWTHDVDASLKFYGAMFGIENRETMDMGDLGGYHFLDLGGVRIGAAAAMKNDPPQWLPYFCVDDVDAAAERARAAGGTVDMGPMAVPGGSRIVVGTDPQSARFALVAPKA